MLEMMSYLVQHRNGCCFSSPNGSQNKLSVHRRVLLTTDARKFLKSKILSSSARSVGQVDWNMETGKVEKKYSYLLRTEKCGLVKVIVADKSSKYSVDIEVSSMPKYVSENNLVMEWGLFKSDSSCLYSPKSHGSVSVASQVLTSEVELAHTRTPFVRHFSGEYTINLDFDSYEGPFFLSFLLLSFSNDGLSKSEIRSHRKTQFCVPVGISHGSPMPLGVSISNDGCVNFSIFSRNAESVTLCLYREEDREPALELKLDSYLNRTGDVWHISIEKLDQFVRYGYRCKGTLLWNEGSRFHLRHVLLDPYAKRIGKLSPDQGDVSPDKYLGFLHDYPDFDWAGDIHPRLPMEKLVVYRLNVGLFTKDSSSGLPEDLAGTFYGVIEKMQHLKALGINAILLEPVVSFDESKCPCLPYHFFSPTNSYGRTSDGLSTDDSLKTLVKTLHAHGMEVLMEVDFTRTAEGGDANPHAISFRCIDCSSYYFVHEHAISGEYNTLRCSNPVVQDLILDSLRYWAMEFHIDGFCFIDALSLTKGSNGDYLSRPPLIEAIAFDPILSDTKIIADCWSPLDLSFKDIRFPHWKRWAEMNFKFCTDVGNFFRGQALIGDLATRLCGSGDKFSASRGPSFSFNYITKNSGLSLVDLVSFGNQDSVSEHRWNCGEEGPSRNIHIIETCLKQIRNFLFVLFLSLGVPVLNMGDECGHSAGGPGSPNNRLPINWNSLKTGFGAQITEFISFLSSFRLRRSDIFQRKEFLKMESIEWRGSGETPPNWEDPMCKFLGMMLKAEEDYELYNPNKGHLFLGFNASEFPETVILPELPEGDVWLRLIDTAMPFPGFFSSLSDSNTQQVAGLSIYEMKSNSCTLFESKKACHLSELEKSRP